MWHATQMRVQSLVLVEWLNGNSPPHSGPHNFSGQHAGFRSDHGAALHANVIAKADLTSNHAVIFNCHAAADSGLGGDDHALADIAVVSDVNHVVEFGSPANARPAQSTSVDRRVR